MSAEGSGKSCQERDNTSHSVSHDASEASVSGEHSRIYLEGQEDDLDPASIPGVSNPSDPYGDSDSYSYPTLTAESHSYPASLSEKVLKGPDLFLSKACEDDSDAQSDSPLTSPLPEYSLDTSSDFARSSQQLERFGACSAGFGSFPLKRGRGRPRKDPFSPVTRRPR